MKKLLVTFMVLIAGINLFSQAEVWEDNTAPGTIRAAVNAKFVALQDSLIDAHDSINVFSDSIIAFSGTLVVHRGLIDLNYAWIYDIMNDSLPRLTDSVSIFSDSIYSYDTRITSAAASGGGSMVYPGAGIPLSTGSGWGTSITDNSENWNTSFGWGDHAVPGYLTSVGISDLTATGTASSSTYLRGDNTWATVAGSSYTFSDGLNEDAGTITWDSTEVYRVQDSIKTALADTGQIGDYAFVFADTTGSGKELATSYDTDTLATNAYAAMGGGSTDTTNLSRRIDSLATELTNLEGKFDQILTSLETLDSDVVAPQLTSIEIGTYDDSIFVMLFDTTDIHQDSVPLVADFDVTEDGNSYGITTSGVSISLDTVFLAMDSAGLAGATYLVDYTKGIPALQDSTGNETASWTDESVTNNITEASPEQNLVLYSEQIDDAEWAKTNLTISTNVTDDLDGETTIDRCTPESSEEAYLEQDISDLSASTDYVFAFDAAHDGSWGSNDLIAVVENRGDFSTIVDSTYHTSISSSITRIEIEFTTPSGLSSDVRFKIITCSWLDDYVEVGRVHVYEGEIGDKSYVTTTDTAEE